MARVEEQYIVDEKSTKSTVILPIAYYEELLEDLHNLGVIADRRSEPTIARIAASCRVLNLTIEYVLETVA